MRCDVIIPIYNAYDALNECVDSVIKNTDLTVNGLILINDCSPDKRISTYIKGVKEKYSDFNIEVFENEQNLGFVGTVNKGMKNSANDVLLLNSDTVVGKNWLEKIKECAYKNEKIATVTPLSNNATLVSVPKGLMRNEVLDDITLDEYNSIVEKCAYNDCNILPTAHGFCMFIKRDVLNAIGFFDEESFGKGYGEENDFSYRCMDYGYTNVVCDNTIVYHKEKQSFSNEKDKVAEAHALILEKRYPEYSKNLEDWLKAFPIAHICKNVDYNLKLNKRKNVLLLIHDFESETGGTTLHIKDIISNLSDKYNFHVLYPKNHFYMLCSCFKEGNVSIRLPYSVSAPSRYTKFNNNYAQMLSDIIVSLGISAVHVHHMIGHYFDIADVCLKFGIKPIITLHDYYSVCPTINLLYKGSSYCLDNKNADCKKCLSTLGYCENNIIDIWQKDWHKFLSKFSKIIVPSEDTKTRMQQVFSDLDFTVIEHGVEISKNLYEPNKSDIFNCGFIGVLCETKGGYLFKKTVDQSLNKNIRFHSFGISLIPSLKKNKKNYNYHGEYRRDNLIDLLHKNKIDLICLFQIVPETYSYTLNEAISAGIPVITLDIGAGAQRVKKDGIGWVLPVDSTPKQILDYISKIKNDKSEYNKVLDNIRNYKVKSVKDMAAEYLEIYNAYCLENIHFNIEKLRELLKSETENDFGDYYAQRLEDIEHSIKWRLISKIRLPKSFGKNLRIFIKRLRGLIK